jgi:hypothetical protein
MGFIPLVEPTAATQLARKLVTGRDLGGGAAPTDTSVAPTAGGDRDVVGPGCNGADTPSCASGGATVGEPRSPAGSVASRDDCGDVLDAADDIDALGIVDSN